MRKLMARKQKSGPRPLRSPVAPNIRSASRNVVFPMRTLMRGGGDGGGAHSRDEWFSPVNSHQGPQMLLLALARIEGVSEPLLEEIDHKHSVSGARQPWLDIPGFRRCIMFVRRAARQKRRVIAGLPTSPYWQLSLPAPNPPAASPAL